MPSPSQLGLCSYCKNAQFDIVSVRIDPSDKNKGQDMIKSLVRKTFRSCDLNANTVNDQRCSMVWINTHPNPWLTKIESIISKRLSKGEA